MKSTTSSAQGSADGESRITPSAPTPDAGADYAEFEAYAGPVEFREGGHALHPDSFVVIGAREPRKQLLACYQCWQDDWKARRSKEPERNEAGRDALSKLKEWRKADGAAEAAYSAWQASPSDELWKAYASALAEKWHTFGAVAAAADELLKGE
jgi:hypothetical protein